MSAEMAVFDDMAVDGEFFDFFGVDGNAFKVGGAALEAVEDPDDGYRSCLKELRTAPDGSIFFRSPVARVCVRVVSQTCDRSAGHYYSFRGWELVDADEHRWLRVGTIDYDDYYPCFTFEYSPRKSPAPE